MRKRLFILFVLVAIAVGVGGAVKVRNGGPKPIAVDTGPAALRTIVQTVSATGRIQPKTQVNISADVSAKITHIAVAEGDWVEKGDLLLELDRERYLAAVEIAQAGLNAATSNVELARENAIKAEKDYRRIKELFDKRLESQARLDATYAAAQAEKARLRSMQDQVEQARAALKQRQDELSKTRIFAPLAGTVSKLDKEEGEIALGSQFQADVIMEVSNLNGMEALVDVDENDIVLVALGNRASIEVDALPGVTLEGTVSEIANSAKQSAPGTSDQKTEFEVKVTVKEPDPKLRPGMTASAEIVTETKEGVLGIPIQCVAVRTPQQVKRGMAEELAGQPEADFKPGKDGFLELVFVVEEGRALARQVRTGIQSDSHIEILEGLEEGEQVVVGNYRAISKDLQHGSLVAVKNGSRPAPDAVMASN